MQLAPWSGYSTTPEAATAVRGAEAAVVLADAHATLGTAVDLGDADAPKTDIHNRPKQVQCSCHSSSYLIGTDAPSL